MVPGASRRRVLTVWLVAGAAGVVVLVAALLASSAVVSGPASRERALDTAGTGTGAAATPGPRAIGTTAYATRLATLISALAARRGLSLDVRADLRPRGGGDARTPAAVARYRQAVRTAALTIRPADSRTARAWRTAGASARARAARAWARLVHTLVPRARVTLDVRAG
jgi:hypothetical protein